MNEIAKTVLNSKAALELLEKTYNDSLRPPAKEVGKALKDIFKALRLLTLPFQGLAFLQAKIDIFLDESLRKTRESNRIMPPGQVILKVYQELMINNPNTETMKLLSNLMARFIDKTRVNEAHPAFLILIPQLCNDEIKILKRLKGKEYTITQYAPYNKQKNLFGRRETKENKFPLNELIFPDNFFLYIDHLYSLNLAGCWQTGNQTPDMAVGIQCGDQNISQTQCGTTINSSTRLTEFGILFATACL